MRGTTSAQQAWGSDRPRGGRLMSGTEAANGELLAIKPEQGENAAERPVDGIDERTSGVNPDSSLDRDRTGTVGLGASEQGGMAGAVGYFEGEGNEGAVAPLGGDPGKGIAD